MEEKVGMADRDLCHPVPLPCSYIAFGEGGGIELTLAW